MSVIARDRAHISVPARACAAFNRRLKPHAARAEVRCSACISELEAHASYHNTSAKKLEGPTGHGSSLWTALRLLSGADSTP